MVREIIQIGDQTLYTKSIEVTPEGLSSRETQELIQDMIDTCNLDPKGTGGLSAVQVGELKRIFIVNRLDKTEEGGEWEVVVNPILETIGNQRSVAWEGCLSVGEGDKRLFGPVERADHVKLKYLNRVGESRELEANDFFAHVIQHEVDHLDGILFLRHIKNPLNIWTSGELDDYIDDNGELPEVV